MSVSDELLCSFELLKPLDSTALKNHIKKGRSKRNHMLNSPVSKDALAHGIVGMLIELSVQPASVVGPQSV